MISRPGPTTTSKSWRRRPEDAKTKETGVVFWWDVGSSEFVAFYSLREGPAISWSPNSFLTSGYSHNLKTWLQDKSLFITSNLGKNLHHWTVFQRASIYLKIMSLKRTAVWVENCKSWFIPILYQLDCCMMYCMYVIYCLTCLDKTLYTAWLLAAWLRCCARPGCKTAPLHEDLQM